MYLMYVDESGDCGMAKIQTEYFVLTGVVVHETYWRAYLDQFVDFRKRMRDKFKLPLQQELHAAHMLTRPGDLFSIKKNDRLAIIRHFADELASMTEFRVISVVVDKKGKATEYDVFGNAWRALLQRFENTLSHRNFPGAAPSKERGMVFPDHTDDKKLVRLTRKLRRYNPVPSVPGMPTTFRNLPLGAIVEDPNFRDSRDSLFVQAADLCACLLYQHLKPCAYMRKKGGQNYFHRLEPILCKVASKTDPLGIVRL
jgi:hypothetical protein